jgi:hypothetical protein
MYMCVLVFWNMRFFIDFFATRDQKECKSNRFGLALALASFRADPSVNQPRKRWDQSSSAPSMLLPVAVSTLNHPTSRRPYIQDIRNQARVGLLLL